MTLENKHRDDLLKYRLEQAEEAIADVKLLMENNRYRLLLIGFIMVCFILYLHLDLLINSSLQNMLNLSAGSIKTFFAQK